VIAIDPERRRVETEAGPFDADILVVALGADVHPGATPGLVEHGYEFYTVEGAFALRDVLPAFRGGRVVIAVTSTPFKCPPAPSETALLMDEFLTARGLRAQSEIHLVMPFGVPIPPSPVASTVIREAFGERRIHWHPELLVRSLDAGAANLNDGTTLTYDLFLGVPVHRAPDAVKSMTVDGWIPVDPLTLETSFPGVYAVGDVTSVGTPKAGVFAEGQAAVAAARIIATINGTNDAPSYDGRGICYMEFGGDRVAKVDVTFRAGERPFGGLEGPSIDLTADKVAFGASRIRRWFEREWNPIG
jgi:sulfide:quinone oxidoreductase